MNNHSLLNSAAILCLAGYTKTKIDDLEKRTGGPILPSTGSNIQDIKKLEKENNVIAGILVSLKETNDKMAEEIESLKKRLDLMEKITPDEKIDDAIESEFLELLKEIDGDEQEDLVMQGIEYSAKMPEEIDGGVSSPLIEPILNLPPGSSSTDGPESPEEPTGLGDSMKWIGTQSQEFSE